MIHDERLHQSKLKTFKRYVVSQGYKIEPRHPAAHYEVLRLRHGSEQPLLYFQQDDCHRITAAHGEASDLVTRWLEKRKPVEEIMASLMIDAELNRTMGIANAPWIEDMLP
ncbi:hypothetical protein G3T14_20870 [Methylobacterium sp. BTF04]|uniref:hypothetical protein n=1 Tax=Methylobacterium sp. BTF04 TaxID=2708300 RepID=UPI0013D7F070|nr:hypothetical protein [Methylobacterium sp. BTF04]NEU14552.1 hypothetical protein [Methylobacterium sp. BTF04]